MNARERKMAALLAEMKADWHLKGVKAEFEGEGATLSELLRLKEVTMRAGVGLSVKIGGCEALTDLRLARLIGVAQIIAPVIESPFSVRKFVGAAAAVFSPDELEETELLINVETIDGCRNFDAMLALPEFGRLRGLDIGRGDLSASLGKPDSHPNTQEMFSLCEGLCRRIKASYPGMECNIGVGGPMDHATAGFLARLAPGLVDGFETKKVILGAELVGEGRVHGALRKAIEFERLWVDNLNAGWQGMIDASAGYIRGMEAYDRELASYG